MKVVKKDLGFLKIAIITLAIIFSVGCEEYFDYSPYEARVHSSYKNTDEKNLQYIKAADTAQKEEIRFAVFADSHYMYDELGNAVKSINNYSDIDFVIANGDIADHGYLKEYEFFHEKMEKLKAPYMTVIGNHDYRSNGGRIYAKMFGAYNKSFTYNNNLFILFDDVFWESNKNPDMDWLENELSNASNFDHIFVICHIPPYGEQFNANYEEKYKELMLNYNVDLSIHGHIHRNIYGDYYDDGMIYLTVEALMDKEYSIVTVSNTEVRVDNIKF